MHLLMRTAMIAVAVCCIAPVYAQQQPDCHAQLYIKVADAKDGAPVIGATAAAGALSSMSDENGIVLLDAVCAGAVHLHVQGSGYVPFEDDYKFQSGDTITVRMKAAAITLDDIEVAGHKTVLATPNASTTLQQADLDKLKGGNLATMLSTVPGVTMLQTGATIGKPVVNGMHSNRLLILNNGIRQEGQQWGAEHAPEIDPFIAQSITVVKGAEAIRYGAEAIGGVVIIQPPALPRDSTIHAELNLVGASNGRTGTASGMLSGNFKKIPALSWRLQGTGKQSGNYKTADYFLDNTGVKELNYSAALGYTKEHFDADIFYSHFNNETGIFKGSHIGSTEDLNAAIANERPFDDGSFYYDIGAPRQKIVHDLLKATSHIHLSDYLHLNILYGFQHNTREEYDMRRGGRSDVPTLAYNLNTHTLDASAEYFNGSDKKLTIGVNGLYQQNKKVDGTGTQPLIPDFNTQGAGLYAVGRKIMRDYELEAGLRYDYKYLTAAGYRNNVYYGGRFNFHNVTASIGGVYHLMRGLDIRSNVGTAWRPPTVNELYSDGLHQSVSAVERGDSTLKAEKSVKWITSLEYNRNKWLTLNADVYANYFNNYIFLRPTGEVEERLRGAFPVFQTESGNTRFLGADFRANARFLKYFDYTLKGSVIRAKNLSANTYLPMIPADRLEQAIRMKYATTGLFKESYLQLSHVFVAKQNRYVAGSDFAPPPPAYHLLNIMAGTQFKLGKHDLSLNVEVSNVGNVLYKDYMNRFRYYAHDIGRNVIVRMTYRI